MPVSRSSWMRVRWLVWLIRSLVVSRAAGSFTPTLSIRHPHRPPDLGDSSASQRSGCLLPAPAIDAPVRASCCPAVVLGRCWPAVMLGRCPELDEALLDTVRQDVEIGVGREVA